MTLSIHDAKAEKVRRLCYRDLSRYKRLMYRRYSHAPHLALLDDHLMSLARYVETDGKEGINRLIVEMPPRHGKTLTVSRLFPTWFLGRNPDKRVMLVGYGADLTQKNSWAARNFIKSPRFRAVFPGITLSQDSAAREAWNLEGYEGGVDAIGIGGGATGKGADLSIIDDPIKSRSEAESQTYRDKIYTAYTDDLLTRLEPNAVMVIMMTRWHQDDLIGRVLKNEPGVWSVVSLPAIAESGDILNRSEGEALWSERYPINVLQERRETMGAYSFGAMFQQRPSPAEGGIFKRDWFQAVSAMPKIVESVRYWDLAMSSKETADYTVGVRLDLCTDGNYYVSDVSRWRAEWPDVVPRIVDVILRDGPKVFQGIEMAGYMTRAVKALNSDRRLRMHTIRGYKVDTDKLTRALPVAAKAASGMLYITVAGWNRHYVDELASFPNGEHDDQVDATSGAWNMFDSKPQQLDVKTSRYA